MGSSVNGLLPAHIASGWVFRVPVRDAHRKEHPLRSVMKLASLTLVGAVALAACSSSSTPSSSTGSSPSPSKSSVKVGLAYDIGGRGDKSFNDSAGAGLDKAVTDLGIEKKELSAVAGETESQRVARLTVLAVGG